MNPCECGRKDMHLCARGKVSSDTMTYWIKCNCGKEGPRIIDNDFTAGAKRAKKEWDNQEQRIAV